MSLSLRSRPHHLNRAPTAVTLLALLGLFALGCTRQTEGERCDQINQSEDCEGTLVCVDADKLRGKVSRCCQPDGTVSDERCDLVRDNGGSGGSSGGSAGQAGQAGQAGATN